MNDKVKRGYITDLHKVFGKFDDFILTKYGSIIGGIELSGRDFDSLLPDDFIGLSFIARNIYEKLPHNVTLTQFFLHYDGAKIHMMERKHPIVQLLTKNRENFLNNKNLTESRLFHYFEFFPSEKLNKLDFFSLLKHLTSAAFDKKSRTIVKEYLSHEDAIVVQYEELLRQVSELKKILSEISDKWNGVMSARILSLQDMWAHSRFLATANQQLLFDALDEPVPEDDWDKRLTDGDINQISFDGTDMLKVNGEKARYLRIASITGFGKRVMPGVWAYDDQSLLRLNCNFIVMTRWRPLSNLGRSLMFKKKEAELERASLNLFDLVSGEKKSAVDKKALMKPAIAEKHQELAEAEGIEDKFGYLHAMIMTFDTDAKKVLDNSRAISKSFGSSGLSAVWESVYLQDTFEAMQLAGGKKTARDTLFTSTQMGATSLLNKSVTGDKQAPDIPNEEALFAFECADGSLFYLNPYVGGKAIMICVGPIGTGKSFLRNVLGGHFLKYGGMLRTIDIDPGSEPLAQLFGDDGGIFRITANDVKGFNPFVCAKGAKDYNFIRHIKSMLMQMIKVNDQEDLQVLTRDDQYYLDKAIIDTLNLPKDLQRLGAVVAHMPDELAIKFNRWVYAFDKNSQDGLYAYLFDEQKDSIGALDRKIAVANLQGLRDDPAALSLVMKEVFYRITTVFEDPKYLNLPKQVDFDEAHNFLKYKDNVDYVVSKTRTWRKWRASLSLWSQGAREYAEIPDWDVLKDAAGTFIFMAVPKMNESEYKKTFGLTGGECKAIRDLIPKKEAYIIQPALGISKKVRLNVDPQQYVIATSQPDEVMLRNKLIKEHGFTAGIAKTVEALSQQKGKDENKRFRKMEAVKQSYYGE